MGENIILGGFAALPVLLLVAIVFFFRKQRGSQSPQSRLKLVLGNALILLLLCSVVLLSGELYYRFVYDTTDSFGLAKTTAKWFERHYHVNMSRFRDSINYRPQIEPGNRRITFLGDSFLVGHGVANVENRYANLIRDREEFDEVHVIGQNGWDTSFELDIVDLMNEYGYQYDLVVLAYCLNDISDIVPGWKETLDKIYHSSRPGFLLQESYFLNTLYCRWRSGNERVISDYYGFIEDAYSGPLWEQQKERLQLLRKKVENQGGRFVVVTLPFFQDLGPNYRYRFVHEQLDQFWEEKGVPHLDLLSLYEPYEAEAMVVNAHDPHPNERAHALAAEAMAPFLKKHLQQPRQTTQQPEPGDAESAPDSAEAPPASTEGT